MLSLFLSHHRQLLLTTSHPSHSFLAANPSSPHYCSTPVDSQHRPAPFALPAPTAMAQHSAAANIGIPLHCNICPKKPNFSDTSHLLTHVASKQHLSNYFKLRVRVNTDSAAQRDVDAYDRWYQDWNLDELMRERMNQKENRTRSGNSGASRRAPAGWCILFQSTASNLTDNVSLSSAPSLIHTERLRASDHANASPRVQPSEQPP